jgi:ParB-like nuclease domain
MPDDMRMPDKMPWPADEVTRRPVAELVPHARNARTHTASQVAEIAGSIREWGWTIPVLVDEDGTIIAGHARVMAASKLGLSEVPTVTARGWTDAQKRAYMIADNRLPLNAEWDDELLRSELMGLQAEGFNLDLIGFPEGSLATMFDGEGDGAIYSRKIEAPIYTPKGDQPPPRELYDDEKAEALKKAIRAADLPADVAAFLEKAAERHTVFNFKRIADYYATAPAETQRLMEASALVIVDFNAAIEHGFVKLNDRLAELATESVTDDDDER